jgi:tRNA (adenine37-N6)-methyltransferase
VLQQDPRPQYQQPDPERVYGMKLLDLELRWRYGRLDGEWHILVCEIAFDEM